MQPVILVRSPTLTKPVDLRQVAVRYINDYIGDAFTVGKLKLKQDQQKWWGLIQYQAKGQCRPVGVGRVEIDAQSGKVVPLPVLLNQILTTQHGDILNRWREVRNQIDYSPYLPADIAVQVVSALDDVDNLVTTCRSELRNRGVTL